MSQRVIRIAELASTKGKSGKLPVSPIIIWRWVREGRFPEPFRLAESVAAWEADEVEAFIDRQAGSVKR